MLEPFPLFLSLQAFVNCLSPFFGGLSSGTGGPQLGQPRVSSSPAEHSQFSYFYLTAELLHPSHHLGASSELIATAPCPSSAGCNIPGRISSGRSRGTKLPSSLAACSSLDAAQDNQLSRLPGCNSITSESCLLADGHVKKPRLSRLEWQENWEEMGGGKAGTEGSACHLFVMARA